MFIADKFIFLELEKTASTHIMRLLARIVEGQQVGKHNRLPAELATDSRPVLGAVRSPWDWYVSLWSYSCGTYGGLYARQTGYGLQGYGLRNHPWIGVVSILNQIIRPTGLWKHLYSDVNDVRLFRAWLVEMFNPKRRYDIGNGYAQSSLSSFSGYFTFMYMYLFARDDQRLFSRKDLAGAGDLNAFFQKNIRHDYVVHVENLEEDLIDALLKIGVDLKDEEELAIRSAKPVNTSKRSRSLVHYYDEETLALVADREAFFIERFGYKMPALSACQ